MNPELKLKRVQQCRYRRKLGFNLDVNVVAGVLQMAQRKTAVQREDGGMDDFPERCSTQLH